MFSVGNFYFILFCPSPLACLARLLGRKIDGAMLAGSESDWRARYKEQKNILFINKIYLSILFIFKIILLNCQLRL
jgi:hypothetical protein